MVVKELYPCVFNSDDIGITDIVNVGYTVSITPDNRAPIPIMSLTPRTYYWLQCDDCTGARFSATLFYLPDAAVFEKPVNVLTATAVRNSVFLSAKDIFTNIILSTGRKVCLRMAVLEGVVWYPSIQELLAYRAIAATPTAYKTAETRFLAAAIRRRQRTANAAPCPL